MMHVRVVLNISVYYTAYKLKIPANINHKLVPKTKQTHIYELINI